MSIASSSPFCTVVSNQVAFNIVVSDSVVIIDCRTPAPPSRLSGSVETEDITSSALLSAYDNSMDTFCPDNSRLVLLLANSPSQELIAAAEPLRKRCSRCLLVSGFDRAYPFLFGTTSLPVYPNQITDSLFLGSAYMLQERLLDDLKITHVLSVMDREISPPFGRKHLRISVVDSLDADLRPVVRAAIPFLEQATAEGARVFVHCEQGVSRSVSVVVAYLMLQHKMKLLPALSLVKENRQCAKPNENFLKQLALLEQESHVFYA